MAKSPAGGARPPPPAPTGPARQVDGPGGEEGRMAGRARRQPRRQRAAEIGLAPARDAEAGVVRCRVGAYEARRQGPGELDVDVAGEPHGEVQLVDDPDPNQADLLPDAEVGDRPAAEERAALDARAARAPR